MHTLIPSDSDTHHETHKALSITVPLPMAPPSLLFLFCFEASSLCHVTNQLHENSIDPCSDLADLHQSHVRPKQLYIYFKSHTQTQQYSYFIKFITLFSNTNHSSTEKEEKKNERKRKKKGQCNGNKNKKSLNKTFSVITFFTAATKTISNHTNEMTNSDWQWC